MPRFILFVLIIVSMAFAKRLIECRVITEGVKECDPYSEKSLPVKEIQYDKDRKEFITFRSSSPPKDEADFWKLLEKRMVKDPTLSKPNSKKALVKYAQELEKYAPTTEDKSSKKPTLRSKVALQKYIQQLENYAKEQQRLQNEGIYTVEQGDVLSLIAKAFGMKTAELRTLNQLKKGAVLHIGQRLKVKSPQEMVDAISSGKYEVKPNDTLIAIAEKFKLSVASLAKVNKLENTEQLAVGKILNLPLPYKIGKNRYSTYGTKILRVTATAYTSHAKQTDDTPFIAAWNNRLVPGMKSIAVSRDLLKIYGLRNGTKVRISGLPGIYHVRDKMNKRYKKRIDIYMGLDKQRALRWGRRSVNIYWD